ncbi:MAG: hypothetical protein CVU25_02060 [Betaproteobacteria bacterium HGW-Betaproteobacteria-19]|nr:MAG: hypothetical protein CVU25_02060 [Betaproteobacteria bacterium HGW-Betaproteobacteria-19]
MQIHLVLPGLIWPSAQANRPAADLALPALERLLGLGQRSVSAFEPLDRQLARLFGLASTPLPLAALRRLGESDLPCDVPTGAPTDVPTKAHADWLCADPVNLSFAREHMLLGEFPPDELSASEVSGLVAALNDTFSDLGRFEASTPTRWYLRLGRPTQAQLYPLHDVIGRPIKHFLPEGNDARLWQRTMNEVQIVLHNHPINQARETAGLRPVNSLWFWGAGHLDATVRSPLPAVQGSDPVTLGLARAAAVPASVPDVRLALRQDTLVILDDLLRPSLQLDLDAWRSALARIEQAWFAPLADALRSGELQHLSLTAPGDRATLQLTAGARDHWRFWRKPLAFDAFLKSLEPAAASTPMSEQPIP